MEALKSDSRWETEMELLVFVCVCVCMCMCVHVVESTLKLFIGFLPYIMKPSGLLLEIDTCTLSHETPIML